MRADPELTVEEFLLLNELIAGEIGISFPDHKRDLLASRLRPRLQALRLRRFFDYYLQARSDLDGERTRLAELVTNHETYFFRELDQIEALFEEAGLGIEPSQGGRLADRLLEALGGYESTRVFKIRGVRNLIQGHGSQDAVGRGDATSAIWNSGQFKDHEGLYIEARETKALTGHRLNRRRPWPRRSCS